MWQSPRKTIALEGDSVNITCSTPGTLHGIYLKKTWPNNSDVIYYEDGSEPTVDPQFQGRIAYSGLQSNLTISLYHLQLADSGGYTCVAIVDDKISGPGTLVMVTGREYASPGTSPPATRQPGVHLPLSGNLPSKFA